MPMISNLLLLDLSMIDSCNLSCDYCREFPKNPEKEQMKNAFKGLNIALKHTDPAVIKLSGYGEVTLFNDFFKLLRSGSQLITNGTMLDEDKIKRLAEIENFSICFSVDGHNATLNNARLKSDKTLDRVLRNIGFALNNNIPVEINSVLTRHNAGNFHLFLDYLSGFRDPPLVFPFPVRPFPGKRNDELFPSTEDIMRFEKNVLDNYALFSRILPAESYLNSLVSFLKKKARLTSCYLPSMILGIDPIGNILSCPCGPTETPGNIFQDSSVLECHPYSEKGHWKQCAACFNHYEIINLYLKGEVSNEDIRRVPSLRSEKAIRFLEGKR